MQDLLCCSCCFARTLISPKLKMSPITKPIQASQRHWRNRQGREIASATLICPLKVQVLQRRLCSMLVSLDPGKAESVIPLQAAFLHIEALFCLYLPSSYGELREETIFRLVALHMEKRTQSTNG